jgi:hypothetical protein
LSRALSPTRSLIISCPQTRSWCSLSPRASWVPGRAASGTTPPSGITPAASSPCVVFQKKSGR